MKRMILLKASLVDKGLFVRMSEQMDLNLILDIERTFYGSPPRWDHLIVGNLIKRISNE